MIDKEQWSLMGTDIKGKIYEGLLEKNAKDTKSGAGQYFTPRSLIKTMVACLRPKPMKTIIDPACGTGGFFLAAYDFIKAQDLDQEEKAFLKNETFYGNEIVANTQNVFDEYVFAQHWRNRWRNINLFGRCFGFGQWKALRLCVSQSAFW